MIALFSLSLLATSAAPSERRTVMAFLSTGVENWAQCKSFLDEGGEAAGTVNAVSICNCYHFDPSATPMITPNMVISERNLFLTKPFQAMVMTLDVFMVYLR